MNDRALQKEKTALKILQVTKKLYLQKGYTQTSTKDIAKKSSVSQGTVFLHYKSKELLLTKVIVDALKELMICLQNGDKRINTLLQTFVDYEALLSRIIKDYPYLPSSFQEVFDQVRMLYKDQLFDLLQKQSKLDILDLFSLIDMVLALIFEDLFYEQTPLMDKKIKKYRNILKKYG